MAKDCTSIELVNPAGALVCVPAYMVEGRLARGFRYPSIADAREAAAVGGSSADHARHGGELPECLIPQTLVEFDPSPRCTRACAFCAPGIPRSRRKARHCLALADHNRAIDGLLEAGFNRPDRWVTYCGHGEPLLNPELPAMIRYAREQLPLAKTCLYTNGDLLSVDTCCFLEAQDLDVLIWDCYDQKSADTVPSIMAASSLAPERVRVNDYRQGLAGASSRCGAVRAGEPEKWIEHQCTMARGKLFFTDNGAKGGARWLLCCEDYARKSKWDGKLSPLDLNADKRFASAIEHLVKGERQAAHAICSRCDRDGGHVDGFNHVPALKDSPFWPLPSARPIPEAPAGRRLVVFPTDYAGARLAGVLLDAIQKASVMPGEVLLLWNDDEHKQCPDELRREGVTVREYPGSLGWCGINRGIADAFGYALAEGYDWVVKLDTDTAILRKGWDAALCSDCAAGEQIGTIMDVAVTGQFQGDCDHFDGGLFTRQLFEHCRWARGLTGYKRRKWDHVQGGCYVIGREALERVDRIVGLGAAEQEPLPEGERIGEDVYIDTKCKVSRVPQRSSTWARIWFRADGRSIAPAYARYWRDRLGVVACHPIKDPERYAELVEEIV